MLRISYMSGEEVASFTAEEVCQIEQTSFNMVEGVKQRLEVIVGQPRFRQKLLHDGMALESNVSLDTPLALQLIIMSFVPASNEMIQELSDACAWSAVEVVETCLQRPQNPDLEDDHGYTALHHACWHGALDCARLLLEARADSNRGTAGEGETPICLASRRSHVDVVNLLLREGADKDKANNENGATPLQAASARGHLAVVRLLLQEGADVEGGNDYDVGQVIDLQLRLLRGADVEWGSDYYDYPHARGGGHPLQAASAGGHLEVVRLLLQEGADKNIVDRNGHVPLEVAANLKNLEVVRLLLQEGADPDYPEVVRSLLQEDDDKDTGNEDGLTS